jgi:hypothetical protein
MNLIKYTLLPDGTIPDYIIDGGYFPKLNNNNSPQDYDLIGISKNNTGIENFTVKADFEIYVKSFNNESYEIREITYYIDNDINIIWDKLNG